MKIEVSNGEIIDKLTILQIKSEKITDAAKLENINRELYELLTCRVLLLKELTAEDLTKVEELEIALKGVNTRLWDVEDELRKMEANELYNGTFVSLARQVYILNDLRARHKKQINQITNSRLVEEKSYVAY
jgi:hypothetical protein